MLTKIHESSQINPKLIALLIPTLPIPKQVYQTYLAFLSQSCEETATNDHMIYMVKMGFDSALQLFNDEDLLLLQEKQDMYLNYIMHSTFKNCNLVDDSEFDQSFDNLKSFYEPTDDELLFIQKIQNTIKQSLTSQISPFTFVEAYKQVFSPKVQNKLINMLKFIIGDSLCYKLSPASIFGLCLKWTIKKYQIKNQSIELLISQMIDIKSAQMKRKLEELGEVMDQVMNMPSE